MSTPANLDAFLPREDFHADGDKPKIHEFQEMGLTELREQWVHVLRKPDFQRTTDDWSAEHIMQFVKSFVESDVIPGVIFWASPKTGNILVIDGAHRISAMLAWIFDDYGDKERSRQFWGFEVSDDQIAAATKARELIGDAVGTFKEISEASTRATAKQSHKKLATSMTAMRFKIQWLQGNAEKAEESFYRINLRSVALDKTEIKLIRNRRKPNPIATRGIIQNAAGHAFWNTFPKGHKESVEKTAKQIHSLLFKPPVRDKTAHLPLGGKAYAGTAMEVTLTLVEYANKTPMKGGSCAQKTVDALNKTLNVVQKLNGNHGMSLGVHPAVYCYSHSTGKHQPAALMALTEWVDSFDKKRLADFTSVRKYFENFLIFNVRSLGETISARGSKGRSVPTLIEYYDFLLNELLKGSNPKTIFRRMKKVPRLQVIAQKPSDFHDYDGKFSAETKSGKYLIDALIGAPTCGICGARYHPGSVNADHKKPKTLGGLGSPQNMSPTHFYCNSTKGSTNSLELLIEAAHKKIEANLPEQKGTTP